VFISGGVAVNGLECSFQVSEEGGGVHHPFRRCKRTRGPSGGRGGPRLVKLLAVGGAFARRGSPHEFEHGSTSGGQDGPGDTSIHRLKRSQYRLLIIRSSKGGKERLDCEELYFLEEN